MPPEHSPYAGHAEFSLTVRAFGADLYRYAYWLSRDRVVAEDLVQECFMRAWIGWHGLRDQGAIKGWLFRILHNENARRFERKPLPVDVLEDLGSLAIAVESDVSEQLAIRQVIEQLPLNYRAPLLLQILGGFSCAEIGVILEISESNAMQRVSRARKLMRELFGDDARRPVRTGRRG